MFLQACHQENGMVKELTLEQIVLVSIVWIFETKKINLNIAYRLQSQMNRKYCILMDLICLIPQITGPLDTV